MSAFHKTLVAALRLGFLAAALCLSSCSQAKGGTVPNLLPMKAAVVALPALPAFLPKIDRRPFAADWGRGKLGALPPPDASDRGYAAIDLRSYDLRALDLRDSASSLVLADFDSRTAWPKTGLLPTGFDQRRILELGKNPGLGIRALHALGYDGGGVGIAIIDQPLIVDHAEYSSQLRLYEEINVAAGTESQMHGPAVASLAVGSSCGVAPKADLYYIGAWPGFFGDGPEGFTYDFTAYAQALDRVMEINSRLPAERKIRVVAMQVGWDPSQRGYREITKAVGKAKAAGLFVLSSSLDQSYGFEFQGLGRQAMAAPDSFESFEPGMFWAGNLLGGAVKASPARRLLVPMDSRTAASPTGAGDYAFYREGGWSWAIPYLAGLYALAVQAKPSLAPAEFWSEALATGREATVLKGGARLGFGRIVDPLALISRLRG
jgi:hypothetical protein